MGLLINKDTIYENGAYRKISVEKKEEKVETPVEAPTEAKPIEEKPREEKAAKPVAGRRRRQAKKDNQ